MNATIVRISLLGLLCGHGLARAELYTHLRNDRAGVVDFAINGVDGGAGSTASSLALGMRHAF